LAILAGAGLTGLIRLAAVTPLGRRRLGSLRLGPLRLAWLPAVLAGALPAALLAALLAGPQQAIRQTAARPDNLRLASVIVAAHADGKGENGAAGRRRDAHPAPLAGRRDHAHPVRDLTAPGPASRAQAPVDSARGVPNPLATSCSRIFLRPRCSRDITVPTGVPIISAISR